ncbi:MAG: hypothetical protein WBE34_14820 [Candidatus Nitrosopolaris sp.]
MVSDRAQTTPDPFLNTYHNTSIRIRPFETKREYAKLSLFMMVAGRTRCRSGTSAACGYTARCRADAITSTST